MEIKKRNQKKKDDVVIFFVDSLRSMDVFHQERDGSFKADMFQKYLKNSVVFTKAKSTGVTTYESMISVIKNKYPCDTGQY